MKHLMMMKNMKTILIIVLMLLPLMSIAQNIGNIPGVSDNSPTNPAPIQGTQNDVFYNTLDSNVRLKTQSQEYIKVGGNQNDIVVWVVSGVRMSTIATATQQTLRDSIIGSELNKKLITNGVRKVVFVSNNSQLTSTYYVY